MAGFDLRKKTVHRKRGPFKERATKTNTPLLFSSKKTLKAVYKHM
jgi:hypothetical protein